MTIEHLCYAMICYIDILEHIGKLWQGKARQGEERSTTVKTAVLRFATGKVTTLTKKI